MKKNYFKPISLLLFTALLITGCQKDLKEVKELNEEIADQSRQRGGDHDNGGCRLTNYDYYDGISDYNAIEYYSYKKGLVDEWLASYGSLFKMEYDRNEKLKIARMYDGETLINTIKFIYRNDKVIKEIWYAGNTNQMDDEVIYDYNRKGQMTRNESLSYDYYVTYTYTNEGDLKSWFYFSGGLPSQKAEYTYRDEFKNPYNARPGIDYSFVYANSGFGVSDTWCSSEKVTFYDEEGSPSVHYDLDPKKTKWLSGPKKYPAKASYIDRITRGSVTNTFEYENCSGHHNDSETELLNQKNINKRNMPAGNFKLLIH